MNNLNVVVLEGRLVRDASEGYKTGKSGTPYGEFTIAVNESRKVDGEWKDETSYIDCKGFGKGYDYAVPRMTKGSLVRVIGKIKQERWTSSDGTKKSRVVVECDRYFTEARSAGDARQDTPPSQQQGNGASGFEEDIPF